MRALRFLGDNKADIIESAPPTPPPGWALVKVHFCCLCGSDLWLYRGRWHGNTYPVVPGHEWAGVVESGDPGWVGRPVVADLISACRTCGPCRDGLPVMCEDLTEIGFTVHGGCAGYVTVPEENLYELPAELDLAVASQAEPLAVALHAADRAAVRPGERVAVLGSGGIGLLVQQAAAAAGATVALTSDPVPGRRAVSLELGAREAAAPDALPRPTDYADKFDVVFEASGDPASIVRSLELVRPGGRVCVVGYQVGAEHPLETARLPLTYGSLLGVMGPGGKFREAVDLLARGVVDTRPVLTDIVRLDDHADGIGRAIDRTEGTVRVVFDLRDE